jgi:hypothetical protein
LKSELQLNLNRFNKSHTEWLNRTFKLPQQGLFYLSTGSRPPKQFVDSTDRTKLMKIKILIDNSSITSSEFIYAAKQKKKNYK